MKEQVLYGAIGIAQTDGFVGVGSTTLLPGVHLLLRLMMIRLN